jgi:AraC-like DNA-binding protein
MVDSVKTDQLFLQTLLKVIDENRDAEDFPVNKLVEKIGLSRTQLHRKTKSATNLSVTEVIRRYKLDKAATMLKEGNSTITVVAFEAGFNNLSYFAKMFKNHYGKTPSEYISENN